MKSTDQVQLGSWSGAEKSADGQWMTHGNHSKKYHILCAKLSHRSTTVLQTPMPERQGQSVIKEELYQKAAEGYGAHLTFKRAKKEGIHIEVHWQDADSSNAVTEHFSDAKVMICGDHACRAHKEQLGNLAKK